MPEPRKKLKRYETHTQARFLTFSCYRRLPLLSNDRIKDAMTEQLQQAVAACDCRLYAWVIMPEHLHLIVRTNEGQGSVQTFLRRLKSPFARAVIDRWRGLKAPILERIEDSQGRTRFWQPGGGYDRNLYSVDELLEKIAYIHHNPVKRGLVSQPTDYAWSSAKWYAGERANQITIDPLPL